MPKSYSPQPFTSAVCLLAVVLSCAAATAQVESVIYNFQGTGDGATPASQLIADKAGNLYGTTSGGQAKGTVFQLTLTSGQWVETTLHAFTGPDGSGPAAGLIMDGKGNLFGTTQGGGNYDDGVVFELQPVAGGWDFSVIHNFHYDGVNDFDGFWPAAPLTLDNKGNLYGTTLQGGTGQCNAANAVRQGVAPPKGQSYYSCGTVFQLSPRGNGPWSERVIHSFLGTDGGWPAASLIFDRAGNLYGTTGLGGTNGVSCPGVEVSGCGVVFELFRNGGGDWTESVLYTFVNGNDGAEPFGGLRFDTLGNLYGSTQGALQQGGSIFELSPSSGGLWTETTLLSLQSEAAGYGTVGNLLVDSAGNLYGTTEFGAGSSGSSAPKPAGAGTVFKLSSGQGGWTATWLHTFGSGGDGYAPAAGLLRRGTALYGTTSSGGNAGFGTVFKLVP